MTWSKQHDVALCREMLVVQPFKFKHGSRDRGQSWDRIAKNLNKFVHPVFLVDQRGVRDRFCKLQKDYKRKKACEERASGICPDEPDELEQALEDITEMEQGQQEQLAVGERNKRLLIEKERETAETIRKRAMERMGETRARENVEKEPKRRKCGGGMVEYLKEKKEQEKIVREGELELRRREMELKEKRDEEEIRMRRKEIEMRERDQNMKEKELESRLKRDQDLIFVLRQQLQQQQVILEQVQQQNKLLLALYQNSLEKKE